MALPRDLQWEVLTEFTGTHVVRKGKLMRKLVVDNRHQLIMDMSRIQQVLEPHTLGDVHTTAVVKLRSGRRITFSQDSPSVCINYNYFKLFNGFYNYGTRRDQGVYAYTPRENLVAPYVNNVYPSYPYTNKKYKKW